MDQRHWESRWPYEAVTANLARGLSSVFTSESTGAATLGVLFTEAGTEETYEYSVVGVEPTYLFSTGVNL